MQHFMGTAGFVKETKCSKSLHDLIDINAFWWIYGWSLTNSEHFWSTSERDWDYLCVESFAPPQLIDLPRFALIDVKITIYSRDLIEATPLIWIRQIQLRNCSIFTMNERLEDLIPISQNVFKISVENFSIFFSHLFIKITLIHFFEEKYLGGDFYSFEVILQYLTGTEETWASSFRNETWNVPWKIFDEKNLSTKLNLLKRSKP